ncbi:MAG TPA: thiamine phosphate synthase [Armatimonadetes bacterium]|nr:thiamine phosphate synthase [Armatimonadota bacterium]
MIEPFGLYLILTNPVAGYERCAEAAVEARVRFLQLRMKGVPRSEVLAMARRLRAITCGTATRLIVNDDPSVAAEVGADGAHLGQEDLPLPEARARWPQVPLWGLSTHSEEQARAAIAWTPDYIGVGPVYPTPTKAKPDPTVGLERLRRILAETPLPAVAIGGIDAERLPDVARAGAENFAVVRAVCQAADALSAIRRLQAIWEEARAGR